MAHLREPISLGEVEGDTISTGVPVSLYPGGPFTCVGEDTSDAGNYDETATISGAISIDGPWVALGTMTADGDKINVPYVYSYVRLSQAAGAGAAGHKLTVRVQVYG